MVSEVCNAKNKDACPYHGNKGRVTQLLNKIDGLFKTPAPQPEPAAPQIPYSEVRDALYKKLILEQLEAVRTWTGGDYEYINRHFREGGKEKGLSIPRWNNIVMNLNKMIAAYPDVEARPLYRGLKHLPMEFGKLKPGAVFTDPGFMSTTDDFKIAQKFADDKNPIFLKITTKKGLPVSDTYGVQENEYLLARGSHFKVTKVKKKTIPSTYGRMEVKATFIEVEHLESDSVSAAA